MADRRALPPTPDPRQIADAVNPMLVKGLRLVDTAPASMTAVGHTGDCHVTTTTFYICVAKNTWRQVTLTTF